MLVHNEHIVEEQPACGQTLCSLEEFKAHYQHIVDFDWDKECPMENAGTTNISLLSSIIIIVTSLFTFCSWKINKWKWGLDAATNFYSDYTDINGR